MDPTTQPEYNALYYTAQRKTGLHSSPVCLGFVVDKVAQGQIFLPVLRVPFGIPFHQCLIFFFTVHQR